MIKNELDEILKYNKEQIKTEEKEVKDVLIMGPTGCGKTSMVEEWLDAHSDEINQRNWFANCRPNVWTYIYNKNMQKEACSPWLFDWDTIEAIDKPDTVFVIDHFDLTSSEARAQMLVLVKDREVSLYNGEKLKLVNGPLMIVAIAFDRAEFGYRDLSPDEIRCFEKVIRL